jgi:hypothetical protein
MARRQRDALALVLCAAMGFGATPTGGGEAEERRGTERADEATADARLLAGLDILRDLELLRQLDVLRTVEELRSTSPPRAPRNEKGKPCGTRRPSSR